MLMLPPSVRIYLATEPVDCRKSFDGLAATTRSVLRQDPLSGHLFVFRNRRGDQLRILVWDRHGFALLCKRLERGVFQLPKAAPVETTHVEVDSAELGLMLDGIDLRGSTRQKRWIPRVE